MNLRIIATHTHTRLAFACRHFRSRRRGFFRQPFLHSVYMQNCVYPHLGHKFASVQNQQAANAAHTQFILEPRAVRQKRQTLTRAFERTSRVLPPLNPRTRDQQNQHQSQHFRAALRHRAASAQDTSRTRRACSMIDWRSWRISGCGAKKRKNPNTHKPQSFAATKRNDDDDDASSGKSEELEGIFCASPTVARLIQRVGIRCNVNTN